MISLYVISIIVVLLIVYLTFFNNIFDNPKKENGMEIVKQGDKTYKCQRCGCEVKIDKPYDIIHGFVGLDDTGFFFKKPLEGDYLICPQCRNKIVIQVDY